MPASPRHSNPVAAFACRFPRAVRQRCACAPDSSASGAHASAKPPQQRLQALCNGLEPAAIPTRHPATPAPPACFRDGLADAAEPRIGPRSAQRSGRARAPCGGILRASIPACAERMFQQGEQRHGREISVNGICQQQQRNAPGGVWASGLPAELSIAMFQRPSSAATRRASIAVGRHECGCRPASFPVSSAGSARWRALPRRDARPRHARRPFKSFGNYVRRRVLRPPPGIRCGRRPQCFAQQRDAGCASQAPCRSSPACRSRTMPMRPDQFFHAVLRMAGIERVPAVARRGSRSSAGENDRCRCGNCAIVAKQARRRRNTACRAGGDHGSAGGCVAIGAGASASSSDCGAAGSSAPSASKQFRPFVAQQHEEFAHLRPMLGEILPAPASSSAERSASCVSASSRNAPARARIARPARMPLAAAAVRARSQRWTSVASSRRRRSGAIAGGSARSSAPDRTGIRHPRHRPADAFAAAAPRLPRMRANVSPSVRTARRVGR